jgi:hypothetical protein
MSLTRRKITIQLVPLLDLMLVVLFLQFMELSEKSRTEEARASQAVVDTQQERAQLRAERIALAERRHEAELTVEKAFDQRDLVGQLAAELFNLPDDTIEKLLRQRFPDDPPTPDEIAAMQRQFRQLKGRRGHEMVKHLLTFAEIRKRCDVWDIYVAENGVTSLKAGDDVSSFRTETPQTFAARLFDHYRVLKQPKSLVIVLLSYGDARVSVCRAAITGLPTAIARMQNDSAGRTRFEYAVIGYDPARLLSDQQHKK